MEGTSKESLSDMTMMHGLTCCLSRVLMRDPVIAADGYSYERKEIDAWFNRGHRTSPVTGSPLLNTSIIPNHNIKMIVDDLIRRHPEFQKYFPLGDAEKSRHASYDENINPPLTGIFTLRPLHFLTKTESKGENVVISWNKVEARRRKIPDKPSDGAVFSQEKLRLHLNEVAQFTFRIGMVETHFCGPMMGITMQDPSSGERLIDSIIEDKSWYLDGAGWLHSIDSDMRNTGWQPSKLKINERVCVRTTNSGRFQVLVNEIPVVDEPIEIPTSDPNVNFWGFITLSGSLSRVELLGTRL